MKNKSKLAIATLSALISSAIALPVPVAEANTKIPLLDLSTSFQIPNASELIGFSRINENWIVAGIDSDEKSWIAQYTQKGEQIWRIFPLAQVGGGEGFITAFTVDGSEILLTGISQNPLSIPTAAEVITTPTPAASETVAPLPTATPAVTKNVPLVNPDNVIPGKSQPLRGDIKNLFTIRMDSSGELLNVFNPKSEGGFIPTSIATRSNNSFIVGNKVNSENRSRGALYILRADGSSDSFTYGSKQTTLNRVLISSANTLTVVGSSADTLADRAVVGRVDGVVLTISQSTGALTKVLRSSGKGATRSWDFASGNLLLSGTSRSASAREGVVTSFTSKAVVSWTIRYPKSTQALASGNCVAVETTGMEVRVFMVDSKGKQSKSARIPRQDLLALATTPRKGCAVLTAAPAGEIRVSYL